MRQEIAETIGVHIGSVLDEVLLSGDHRQIIVYERKVEGEVNSLGLSYLSRIGTRRI